MLFDQISYFLHDLVKILIKIDQISYFLCDLVKILMNLVQISYFFMQLSYELSKACSIIIINKSFLLYINSYFYVI